MDDRSLQVRGRVLFWLWVAATVVVSIQANAHHNNNFVIFRTSWFNLLAGTDLYAASPRHADFFKYSPTFPVLFAPIAIAPALLGMLVWNAANSAALYWGLGRVLTPEQSFAARTIVLMDTVGSMQNAQSNALVAGLMLIACGELERRRELRAAIAIALGTATKAFPILAAAYVIFRPYRLPRFALFSLAVAVVFIAVPLLIISPAELMEQYRSWGAIQRVDSFDRGYSVMEQLQIWFGQGWPNKPIQLAGILVLLAPLVRLQYWGIKRYRTLFIASVLMFCVLFNHKSESPTFVVALAGVAIWFALAPRTRFTWSVLALVAVGTILSSSAVMPEPLQEGYFEPYKLKTLPVVLVWIITQVELWRQSASTPLRDSGSFPSTMVT